MSWKTLRLPKVVPYSLTYSLYLCIRCLLGWQARTKFSRYQFQFKSMILIFSNIKKIIGKVTNHHAGFRVGVAPLA